MALTLFGLRADLGACDEPRARLPEHPVAGWSPRYFDPAAEAS